MYKRKKKALKHKKNQEKQNGNTSVTHITCICCNAQILNIYNDSFQVFNLTTQQIIDLSFHYVNIKSIHRGEWTCIINPFKVQYFLSNYQYQVVNQKLSLEIAMSINMIDKYIIFICKNNPLLSFQIQQQFKSTANKIAPKLCKQKVWKCNKFAISHFNEFKLFLQYYRYFRRVIEQKLTKVLVFIVHELLKGLGAILKQEFSPSIIFSQE